MCASSERHWFGLYCPVSIVSLVAPAVRNAVMSQTSESSASAVHTTSRSSKRIVPRCAPAPFHGVHGMTCFCPLSAMPANQRPRFGFASHARMRSFSPFVAVTSPSSSKRIERFDQRIGSFPSAAGRAGQGEKRAQIATHASHTTALCHERTRPGVVVSEPPQSA